MAVTYPNNGDNMSDQEPDDEILNDDDEHNVCDCCGRDLNGYDSGDPCPMCCSHSYACGSEECDWCTSSDECAKLYARLLK